MVSVTLRLIHRYLPGEKECLQQLSVAGSIGLAGDNEDWWQPTNCCIRFVERQGDQMAWEVKPEKRAIPARYSSVLSELLTAHSQRGQQQGQRCTRSLADSAREEWQEKSRGHVENLQLEETVCGFCLLETERLWASLSLFLIPYLQNRAMNPCWSILPVGWDEQME